MRRLTIVLLALGVASGACERADTTATTTTATATDRAAAGNALASNPPAAGTAPAPEATTGSAPAIVAEREKAPTWREVTLPAGTSLRVVLDTGVGSDTSRVESPVQAHLARAITVDGQTVLAEGSRLSGVVTDATRSAKVKGRAHVAVRFDTLTPRGDDERYRIRTSAIARTAPATKKADAVKIGAPAAGGAIIGGIIGGKKGAAIGTAAGGGAGTAVVLSTRGKEVHLAKGAAFTLKLTEPLTVRIRRQS